MGNDRSSDAANPSSSSTVIQHKLIEINSNPQNWNNSNIISQAIDWNNSHRENKNNQWSPPVDSRSGQGYSWNNLSNKYNVEDTNNLGQRGYINPATKQPYPGSCQPYAANLSRVMDEHMKHSGGMRFENFEERDKRFIFEVVKHKYPNRSDGYIKNSKPNSKILKDLE